MPIIDPFDSGGTGIVDPFESPKSKVRFKSGPMSVAAIDSPSEQPSFAGDVAGQTAKDLGSMALNVVPSAGRMAWGAAKGAFNVAGDALIPEMASGLKTEGMKAAGQGIRNAVLNPVDTAGRVADFYKGKYGNAQLIHDTFVNDPAQVAMDAGALLGGAGLVARGAGAATGLEGLSAAGRTLAATGGKVASAPFTMPVKAAGRVGQKIGAAFSSGADLDSQIGAAVTRGMEKGIRPSVAGKSSIQQQGQYFDRAKSAVDAIITNKPNLNLTNEFGEPVAGLPKNLKQFAQAINQTKGQVFQKYDALTKEAGGAGATVDLNPISAELQKVADNPVIRDTSPGVAEYAKSKAEVYGKRGSYTTQEAQDAITAYNTSLDAFYKNPSYDTASRAAVDSLVVNNIRKSLDAAIEGATGKQYQELKNVYGSLKSIEKDVNHRAVVDARKNPKGLIDFSDIFSGAELARGLMTLNPAAIGEAAAVKGISALLKRANDPNIIVGRMFKKVEGLSAKRPVPVPVDPLAGDTSGS